MGTNGKFFGEMNPSSTLIEIVALGEVLATYRPEPSFIAQAERSASQETKAEEMAATITTSHESAANIWVLAINKAANAMAFQTGRPTHPPDRRREMINNVTA